MTPFVYGEYIVAGGCCIYWLPVDYEQPFEWNRYYRAPAVALIATILTAIAHPRPTIAYDTELSQNIENCST